MITQSEEVPNQPGTVPLVGSIAGLFVPLAGLLGLFYGRQNDWFDVPEETRTDIQHAKLQSEFDDWVTTGAIPTDKDRSTIEVDSLEGLVDVAFDSNRRVIEDAETGVYVVRDNGVWYQYTPEWTETDGTTANGGDADDRQDTDFEEDDR